MMITIPANFSETQCSKVLKFKSASEVLEWGSYCDQNPQWRQQVKLHFRIKVYLVLKKTKPVYHLFFACCSALCGLLADSEGGTMFRWEDNTCTVATYSGLPDYHDYLSQYYQDGKVSSASSLIYNVGSQMFLFQEPLGSVFMNEGLSVCFINARMDKMIC